MYLSKTSIKVNKIIFITVFNIEPETEIDPYSNISGHLGLPGTHCNYVIDFTRHQRVYDTKALKIKNILTFEEAYKQYHLCLGVPIRESEWY